MTTEQLKLKHIIKAGVFSHNEEKFVLDMEATRELNNKHGVNMSASIIWLVGKSEDGKSTIEKRSFFCQRFKPQMPEKKEEPQMIDPALRTDNPPSTQVTNPDPGSNPPPPGANYIAPKKPAAKKPAPKKKTPVKKPVPKKK